MNVCKCNIVRDVKICELCMEYNGMSVLEVCEVEVMMVNMWKWINDYFEMLIDEGVII